VLLTGRRHDGWNERKDSGIAEVTQAIRHPIVKVDEGMEIRVFSIRAKMHVPAHRYSQDLFRVKVLKPIDEAGGRLGRRFNACANFWKPMEPGLIFLTS
jgi:hypothetical protein